MPIFYADRRTVSVDQPNRHRKADDSESPPHPLDGENAGAYVIHFTVLKVDGVIVAKARPWGDCTVYLYEK